MGSEVEDRIPPGWEEKLLIDCTSDRIISYGIVQPGSHVDDGVPIVRVNNVSSGNLDLSSPLKVSPQIEESFIRTRLNGGEVLLTLVGSTGQSVIAPSHLKGWNVARAIAVIRPHEDVGAKWIDIVLKSKATASFLDAHANTTVQKTLNLKDVKRLPVLIPPKEIKHCIERCITCLDDKIELNRQMNTTLEAMAQALFKSWFVDFDPVIDNALAAGNEIPEELAARAERRSKAAQQQSPEQPHTLPAAISQQFPDRFVFTESMGWVPEGWEVRSMAEMVSLIIDHRGKTPKKLGGDWSSKGYPAISAKNIKNGRIVRPDSIRYVDTDLYAKWMKYPLHRGDIALTSEAPLGELYYFSLRVDYLLSQRLFGIRANAKLTDGCFLYFWLRSERGQSELENRATGTTVVGIRQSELLKTSVLSPPINIVKQFSNIVDAQLSCINKNENQSSALADLRDTLLPKLLSGQLRIPEAEQLVAEVI